MLSALQRYFMEETYDDVRLWIFDIVHQYAKRYGGDFHELIGEANYLFVVNLPEFDPAKGSLTNFLRLKIWYGLQDTDKRGKRHKDWKQELSIEDFPNEEWMLKYVKPCFSHRALEFMLDLFSTIGEDGRQVVSSLLYPDEKLAKILLSKNGWRIERRALRDYLSKYHKWDEDRIDDAFWSITQALTM